MGTLVLPVDHGAQFFTARSGEFRDQVAQWQESGVCHPWVNRFQQHRNFVARLRHRGARAMHPRREFPAALALRNGGSRSGLRTSRNRRCAGNFGSRRGKFRRRHNRRSMALRNLRRTGSVMVPVKAATPDASFEPLPLPLRPQRDPRRGNAAFQARRRAVHAKARMTAKHASGSR